MAFMRDYMNAGDAYAGDPFRFRLPKIRLPKIKAARFKGLGSFVMRAAPFAAGPLGGLLGQLAPRVTALLQKHAALQAAAPDEVPNLPPAVLEFARAFGLDQGDPGPPAPGSPFHRAPSRRKLAGQGPIAKAHGKAVARSRSGKFVSTKKGTSSAHGGGSFASQHPGLTGLATAGVSGIPFVGNLASAGLGQLLGGAGGGASDDLGLGGMRLPGAHRRRINPTNVKALRRSIRRLEGFEHLVKRVMPALLHAHAGRRGGGRMKGHKAGCGCVACRHKGR